MTGTNEGLDSFMVENRPNRLDEDKPPSLRKMAGKFDRRQPEEEEEKAFDDRIGWSRAAQAMPKGIGGWSVCTVYCVEFYYE